MTVRIGASWRIVAVLFLLMTMPAVVRAEPADPTVTVVAPLVQMKADDLGVAPHTVTVSRIIFTPGAAEAMASLPGPRLVLVESGSLAFHAIGDVPVIRAAVETATGPTATATTTLTPVPSPTTDVILNRGDVAPVPIWTMHAFRNLGTTLAVILDIRITSGAAAAPELPTDLDVEVLAEERGLTTLPTNRAAILLGHGTVAVGGIVLPAPANVFRLVAPVDGGAFDQDADGTVRNVGADARDVYVVAIAPSGSAAPRPPEQPPTGPGGAEASYTQTVYTHYGPERQGYWISEPAEREGVGRAAGPFPVVLYLAGCCTNDPEHYTSDPGEAAQWIDHLTRRGAIVVAPRLRAEPALDDLFLATRAAMTELEQPGHAQADWTRLAVIGFSYGGVIGVLYAGAATAEGLPVPGAIFSTVPYDTGTMPDLGAIPASTRVLVLITDGYEDPGGRRVWAALTSVPAEHRDFIMLTTDTHGAPPLIANHEAPATAMWGTMNAFDWYGTWKLGDALMSCAFAGQGCGYALGNTPEQRFMGYWSDGVPVAELQVIDDPGPPDPETPTP